MNDKIETLENAIRHINTASDVDQWAKQTAVEAMRYMIASLVSKPQKMRGRWKHRQSWDRFVCSECSHENMNATNFCPNCGARMDGGEQE